MNGSVKAMMGSTVEQGSESRPGGAHKGPAWRVLPALGLFVVAPLVAEFLLGNMTVSHLGMLAILAPVYGGGSLLIREVVRRAHRGWGSIFLLALAYGVLEEAFMTETLFNPDYLGLHLHLLEPAYVPWLGIGARYTIFVLAIHAIWSISVPIALVEALVPRRAADPWLNWVGASMVAVLFLLAAVSMASFSIRTDRNHFVASPGQLGGSAALCLLLILGALRWPRSRSERSDKTPPGPWAAGFFALLAGSAFLLVPETWGWAAVAIYLALGTVAFTAIYVSSGCRGWDGRQEVALAGGAALAYAWHAFIQTPSIGTAGAASRAGNALFAFLATCLIAAGVRKTSRFERSRH